MNGPTNQANHGCVETLKIIILQTELALQNNKLMMLSEKKEKKRPKCETEYSEEKNKVDFKAFDYSPSNASFH